MRPVACVVAAAFRTKALFHVSIRRRGSPLPALQIRNGYATVWRDHCGPFMSLLIAPDPIASAEAFNAAAAEQNWPMLCDADCDFTSPLLSNLLSLWRSEAAGGIPARAAMTARKLQAFMRDIAIYERFGEGEQRRYRIRLMGSGIAHYYGELTGKYVDQAVPEEFLPRWYALSDVALFLGAPVRLLLRADTFDKSYMVAEYFCAPLAAENGAPKFVLLGMIFDGRRPWSVVEAEARQRLGLIPAN